MAGYIETVKTIDTILWKMGYKDGQDYKWSDRDRVLTFKSDDVRKEVAAKIPAKMIHAQYPRTIELEDSAPIHVGQIYFFESLDGEGTVDKVTEQEVTFSVGRNQRILPKSRFEFGVKNGSIKLMKDSKSITYNEFVEILKNMGLEKHSSTLFKEARRGLVNLENQKKLSGGWWDKINTNEIYSLVKRVDLNLGDAKGKNKYKFIVEFMGKEQTVVMEGYSLEEAKKRVMKQDHVTGIKRVVGKVNDSLFKVKDSFGQKFIVSAKTFDSALKKVKDMKLTDVNYLNGVKGR